MTTDAKILLKSFLKFFLWKSVRVKKFDDSAISLRRCRKSEKYVKMKDAEKSSFPVYVGEMVRLALRQALQNLFFFIFFSLSSRPALVLHKQLLQPSGKSNMYIANDVMYLPTLAGWPSTISSLLLMGKKMD